eukprot:1161156-Pelagomonas_calceolata.AAC.2
MTTQERKGQGITDGQDQDSSDGQRPTSCHMTTQERKGQDITVGQDQESSDGQRPSSCHMTTQERYGQGITDGQDQDSSDGQRPSSCHMTTQERKDQDSSDGQRPSRCQMKTQEHKRQDITDGQGQDSSDGQRPSSCHMTTQGRKEVHTQHTPAAAGTGSGRAWSGHLLLQLLRHRGVVLSTAEGSAAVSGTAFWQAQETKRDGSGQPAAPGCPAESHALQAAADAVADVAAGLSEWTGPHVCQFGAPPPKP